MKCNCQACSCEFILNEMIDGIDDVCLACRQGWHDGWTEDGT